MTLSTQMYYILVMTKKLRRCHNAGANEGFAGRRHFVREWEPRFVGLLRNVLSCRRKDDMPTQLPTDEGVAHESQSSETVIDEIMTHVVKNCAHTLVVLVLCIFGTCRAFRFAEVFLTRCPSCQVFMCTRVCLPQGPLSLCLRSFL